MVGVPDLTRWVCGPSVRTAWPIFLAASQRMTRGPAAKRDEQRGHRRQHGAQRDVVEDVEETNVLGEPLGQASSISVFLGGQGIGHPFHFHEARAFDQHGRLRPEFLVAAAISLSTWQKWRAPSPKLRTAGLGRLAQRQTAIDPWLLA